MNIKHVCLAGAAIAALSLGAAAAQADTRAQEDTAARQLDNEAPNARAGAEWQPYTDMNHSAEWISDIDAESRTSTRPPQAWNKDVGQDSTTGAQPPAQPYRGGGSAIPGGPYVRGGGATPLADGDN